MSRTLERDPRFDLPGRVALVEKDLDDNDEDMSVFKLEIRREVAEIKKSVATVNKTLIALLVGVTTTGILLAVNVWLIAIAR